MGEAVSAILAPAIGAAISPIPIIAVILVLFTAKARINAPFFALGWFLGLLVVAVIAYRLSDSQVDSGNSDASGWAFALRTRLGMLLLALRQWRSRPTTGDPATPPPWMTTIDRFTPGKAFGFGALLAGPNPKTLLLSIVGRDHNCSGRRAAWAPWRSVLVYALLGTVSVGGAVLSYPWTASHLAVLRRRYPLYWQVSRIAGGGAHRG